MTQTTDASRYLSATPYIDSGHSSIEKLAQRIASMAQGPRDRALAAFQFVRDEIPFGFASGFWDQKASDVLRAGRGYCNTKSTLFLALLRALGVPCRQVFVDIDAAVLFGVIDSGTQYLDHSYVEVMLEGRWIKTDAYIVDSALFAKAQAKVKGEGRLMGYGVHATGTNVWGGLLDAFAQYNLGDGRPLGTQVWGEFADVGDFYGRAPKPWNRLSSLSRAGFGWLASGANSRLDALRRSS